MKNETPAAWSGRGCETLAGGFCSPFTVTSYRVQLIASRYGVPLETAALIAALAWGGDGHG